MKTRFEDHVTREIWQGTKQAIDRAGILRRSNAAKCAAARQQLKRELTKTANFGSNQNPQFEKAFGSIAFTYLQEKAPGLLEYVIGFQLLDRDEENDKSIGAFVAKVGDQVINIPMIYRKGELTGHHVMHLRHADLFLPLREAFIDYLFSRNPQDLGGAGPGLYEPSAVRGTPNVQPFSGSQYIKGAAERPHVREFAERYGLLESYAQMRTDPTTLKLGLDLKNNVFGSHLDLWKVLTSSPQYIKTAAKLADAYPAFGKKMAQHFGELWPIEAVKALPSVPGPTLRLPSQYATKLGSDVAPIEVSPRLTRWTADQVRQLAPSGREKTAGQLHVAVSPEQFHAMWAEVSQYGDYIRDERPLEKTAKLYTMEDASTCVTAPNCIGIYRVATHPDKAKELLVIPGSCRGGRGSTVDLLVDLGESRWANAARESYLAVQPASDKLSKQEAKAERSFTSTKPSDREVFLVKDGAGQVYGPLVLHFKESADVACVTDYSDDGLCFASSTSVPHPVSTKDAAIEKIYWVKDAVNKRASNENGTLVLPKGSVSYLRLGKVEQVPGHIGDDSYVYLTSRYYKDHKLTLPATPHLDFTNLAKYANLHVTVERGNRVRIGHQVVSRGDARRYLVGNLGLSKTAAEFVLSKPGLRKGYLVIPAGLQPTLKTLTKLAYNEYTPQMPQFQDPYASESGNYLMESPEAYLEQSPLETPRTSPQPFEETLPGELDQTVGLTEDEQAAINSPAGDDLFDMVGLVAILRSGRLDSTIRETTKALLQAINRLGRQLLVFEVHDEEFIERYGETAAMEIRSAMLSTFESAGDLFIALVGQSDTPDPELDMSQLPQ